MRAGRVWAVGAVVAIGALAGCAVNDPRTPATAASTSPSGRGQAFLEPGMRYSADMEKEYRKALAEVDTQLAENKDAFAYGMMVCLDLQQDKTDAQVAENAAARFQVDVATAKVIVKVAKTGLCMQ